MDNCPECGSDRLFKDGLRYLSNGEAVQRWLCRNCSYRFSKKPSQKNSEWQLNTTSVLSSIYQICATLKEAKNLDTQAETKTVCAGGKSLQKLPEETRGLVTKFMAYLERQGYYQDTVYLQLVRQLATDGANLLDPEDVKAKIAKRNWKDSVKMLATYAYDAFCKMEGISWQPPKYKQKDSEIYVPDEKDLDQLIAGTHSKRMATYLQCLKETFADPGEILRLEWKDIKDNIISINYPVKGHLSGKMQVSAKLISMLNALPKTSKLVFPMKYHTAEQGFRKLRKRLAARLQNPRLLNVSFRSFRHFGGTMLAEYTQGNVLTIQKMLRHKSVLNTMKYVHAVTFKDEDYEIATATTPDEVKQLGTAGFVKYDEMNGIHFYRKPKKFRSLT